MNSSNIDIELNDKFLKKLLFLYNAIENGWTIQKKKNMYFFNKKHEGIKKYFDAKFLSTFMENNSNIDNILNELM